MAYNGWANYPTWNVALWINNDEDMQQEVISIARNTRDDKYKCAESLRAYIEDSFGELSGMQADLVNHALDEVDWDELAEAFISDAKELWEEEE
jgi:hypothetical protein